MSTIPTNGDSQLSNQQNPIAASGSSSSLTGAIEKRESTPGPSNQTNVPSNTSNLSNTTKNSTAVTSSISTRYTRQKKLSYKYKYNAKR